MNEYKICHECYSKMLLKRGKQFGITAEYYQCENCGEIVYSIEQFKQIEENYKNKTR